MAEKTVAVFGSGRVSPDEPQFELARQVGRVLAESGFAVANGGYGGTMLAAAQGAAQAGGVVYGVTCSAFEGSVANEYVTHEIVTDSLSERLDTLVKMGQAYVILPGGTGTLLELAMVWELKNKKFMSKTKPIILVGDFWRPVVELVSLDHPSCATQVAFASKPRQVVELIENASKH
jgi:uncharacterized protein (TIGR00730 family)